MASLLIHLPESLSQRLAKEAQRRDQDPAELAREAIAGYLDRRERERFMAELVEAARHLAGDPETVALAEELLPLDNEALDRAEGRKPGDPWPEDVQGWWE